MDDRDLCPDVVNAVPTPLVVVDRDLVVRLANPAFPAAFQRKPESVIGQPLFHDAPDRWPLEELRAALGRTFSDGVELEAFELRADPEEGPPRVLVLKGRRLDSAGGASAAVLITMEDVTDRDRLERQAAVYARELERSNRELEDFAHAASHDLQEPLRKIRMYAERLPGLLESGSMGEIAERYLTRLGEAAERMQDRIDDLLQLARVGRARPRPASIDLDVVVREALEDVCVAADESAADIAIGSLGHIQADPVQIRLLLQNLISNAIKFRESGHRPVIRITATDTVDGGGMPARRIIIEDEGIGFEPEYAEQIFSPFQRLHGRGEYEGSGVGLSLCRRIVEHHAGTIRAESSPGQGSRFIVTLPTSPPDGATP
jgi:signal transduction histidine kinase